MHHPEASYFVCIKGESMIGLGLFDGDICLADRSEEISDGNIVVAIRISKELNGEDCIPGVENVVKFGNPTNGKEAQKLGTS